MLWVEHVFVLMSTFSLCKTLFLRFRPCTGELFQSSSLQMCSKKVQSLEIGAHLYSCCRLYLCGKTRQITATCSCTKLVNFRQKLALSWKTDWHLCRVRVWSRFHDAQLQAGQFPPQCHGSLGANCHTLRPKTETETLQATPNTLCFWNVTRKCYLRCTNAFVWHDLLPEYHAPAWHQIGPHGIGKNPNVNVQFTISILLSSSYNDWQKLTHSHGYKTSTHVHACN